MTLKRINEIKYIHKITLGIFLVLNFFFIFCNSVKASAIQDPILEFNSKTNKLIIKSEHFAGEGLWVDCYYAADNYKTKKYIAFYGSSTDKEDAEWINGRPIEFSADVSSFKSGEYRCIVKTKECGIFGCSQRIETVSGTNETKYYTVVIGPTKDKINEDSTEDSNKSTEDSNKLTEDSDKSTEESDNSSSINCNSWGDAKRDMQNVFDFMKVVIPLLIIGLSTFDFIKAIVEKDDKDIKKAFKKLLKRFAFAILFFFIPVILDLLLYFFEINNEICIK